MKLIAIFGLLFAGTVSSFAATTPQINLTWTASVSSTTATPGTVNVYTSSASGCATAASTSFTQLATGQPAGGPYTVANPPTGTSCYALTAVIGGQESVFSNIISVTVTAPPAAPTGLTGTVTYVAPATKQ